MVDHWELEAAIFDEWKWSKDSISLISIRSGPRTTRLTFRMNGGKRDKATMTFPTREIPMIVRAYRHRRRLQEAK
jgi:hypothetical protein